MLIITTIIIRYSLLNIKTYVKITCRNLLWNTRNTQTQCTCKQLELEKKRSVMCFSRVLLYV